MNKNELIERICDELKEKLAEKYDIEDVSLVTCRKNNGIVTEGISVKVRELNTMPCIYTDKLNDIEDEEYLEKIMDRLIPEVSNAIDNAVRADISTDISLEKSRDRIILALINQDKNEKLLERCPHIAFNDLAITFRLYFRINEMNASTLIDNKLAGLWGLNTEDLWNIAIENSVRDFPARIERLDKMLIRMGGERMAKEPGVIDNPFFIVTNNSMFYGASSLLYKDVPEEIYRAFEENYYILPSSINELIVVPQSICDDKDFLKGMVESVNCSLENPTEYLSDSIYFYDHDRNVISIA
ncbi:MAG: hypothetical protein IJJ74_03305 [Eubacterium sp.]|nr:hypothetical protein [Eubacterium sp.]